LSLGLLMSKSNLIRRNHLWSILIINVVVFFLTKATAGFFALVVSSLFFFRRGLVPKRHVRFNKLIKNVFAIVLIILTLGSFVLINSNRIFRRVESVSDVSSGYVRVRSYLEGFEVFKEHWIHGIGLGNSLYFISTEVIHDMYLSVAAEMGLIGLIVILLILFYLWMKAGPTYMDGIYTDIFRAYLIAIAIQWLSFYNFNLSSFWFFASLVIIKSSKKFST